MFVSRCCVTVWVLTLLCWTQNRTKYVYIPGKSEQSAQKSLKFSEFELEVTFSLFVEGTNGPKDAMKNFAWNQISFETIATANRKAKTVTWLRPTWGCSQDAPGVIGTGTLQCTVSTFKALLPQVIGIITDLPGVLTITSGVIND